MENLSRVSAASSKAPVRGRFTGDGKNNLSTRAVINSFKERWEAGLMPKE